MSTPTFSMDGKKATDLVVQTFPGNPPSSPNAPANLQALHAASQRDLDEILAERRARKDAVRHARIDGR